MFTSEKCSIRFMKKRLKMIIFESFLTIFEGRIICRESNGSIKNDFRLKPKPAKKLSLFVESVKSFWCQFHQHFTFNFYDPRAQKRKMTMLTWLSFFAHLGSTSVKAVWRTLMKLNPGIVSSWTSKIYVITSIVCLTNVKKYLPRDLCISSLKL